MDKIIEIEKCQEFLHQLSNDISVVKGLLSHAVKDEKLRDVSRSYDFVKKSLEKTTQMSVLINDFKSRVE